MTPSIKFNLSYAINVGKSTNAGERGETVGIAAGGTSVCSRAIAATCTIGSVASVGA